MNRSLCCLLFAAVFLTTGCRDELDHELDRTIRELNDVIRNEAVYVERRHRIIRKYRDIADTTRSKRTRAWAYTRWRGITVISSSIRRPIIAGWPVRWPRNWATNG